ncbi:hypothetical protein VTH82DRAFT_6033 [Thermothelomyces myriococcoides]
MLALALAAGVANTLPLFTSTMDCSDAKMPGKEILTVALPTNEKRSQYDTNPRMDLGGTNDWIRTMTSNRPYDQGDKTGSQNAGTAVTEHNSDVMLTDLNIRDGGQMIHMTETTGAKEKDQDLSRSSSDDRFSSSAGMGNWAITARDVFKQEEAYGPAGDRNDADTVTQNQMDRMDARRSGTCQDRVMPENDILSARASMDGTGTDMIEQNTRQRVSQKPGQQDMEEDYY